MSRIHAGRGNSWREQLHRQRVWLLGLLMLGLSGPAGAVAVGLLTGTPVYRITKDPTAVLNAPPYVGALSATGTLLWSAAATVCLLAAAVLRGEDRRFFLWSGLFGVLLAFDDALLLHEEVLPKLLSVSSLVSYPAIYGGYLLLLGVYLARFRRHIMGTDYLLLVVALVAFAASVIMDILTDLPGEVMGGVYEAVAEDGLKFVGIVFWLSYFAFTSVAVMQRS